jgi:hypothetical protein
VDNDLRDDYPGAGMREYNAIENRLLHGHRLSSGHVSEGSVADGDARRQRFLKFRSAVTTAFSENLPFSRYPFTPTQFLYASPARNQKHPKNKHNEDNRSTIHLSSEGVSGKKENQGKS